MNCPHCGKEVKSEIVFMRHIHNGQPVNLDIQHVTRDSIVRYGYKDKPYPNKYTGITRVEVVDKDGQK